METILQVNDIQKFYGSSQFKNGKGAITKAIDHISFDVEKGEFMGIMGASGSGKSTLLNCISTVDTVTSGHIFIEGKDITLLRGNKLSSFRREKLGFIFQDFNLLDTLTAYENISLALSIMGTLSKEINERVKQAAADLGITDILEKFPYQMSGGQQQRVAAARAIVKNPALVLADEPTGSLDSKSAGMLLSNLADLQTHFHTTILLVTHDAFTASWCSRILFIKDGHIFNELYRGNQSRKQFFESILQVVSVMGGDNSNAM